MEQDRPKTILEWPQTLSCRSGHVPPLSIISLDIHLTYTFSRWLRGHPTHPPEEGYSPSPRLIAGRRLGRPGRPSATHPRHSGRGGRGGTGTGSRSFQILVQGSLRQSFWPLPRLGRTRCPQERGTVAPAGLRREGADDQYASGPFRPPAGAFPPEPPARLGPNRRKRSGLAGTGTCPIDPPSR